MEKLLFKKIKIKRGEIRGGEKGNKVELDPNLLNNVLKDKKCVCYRANPIKGDH